MTDADLDREIRYRAEKMWEAVNSRPFSTAPRAVRGAFLHAAEDYYTWLCSGL